MGMICSSSSIIGWIRKWLLFNGFDKRLRLRDCFNKGLLAVIEVFIIDSPGLFYFVF